MRQTNPLAQRPQRLTGAYYWFPIPGQSGPRSWSLLICHDLKCWDGISHRKFWPHVVEHLAAAWGKDTKPLQRRLLDHYTGLPRGRVTRLKTGYVIFHGNDSPVADWKTRIKARFQLAGVKVTPVNDEHERMLGEDHRALQDALGVALGLDKFV
jgi:hypothetical protein